MAKFTGHPITDDSALGGSVIERCIRFRQTSQDANSPNIERTYPSAGNRKVHTFSFWIKRHHLNFETVFKSYTSSSDRAQIDLQSDGRIRYWQVDYTGATYYVQPNRLLRDTNAWYHIVIAVDTTQATAANRVKFYINGNLETDFNNATYPPQNDSTYFNNNWKHTVGVDDGGNDFYIAEIHFVDGYQKEASDFGYTESQTGIWRPKKYTGTYGSGNHNGHYLDFSDGTSLTTLGLDRSGSGNHWTAENFQVAAGYNQDTLFDTPTKKYATLNFLHHQVRNSTLKNGNLYASIPAASAAGQAHGNVPLKSGKWYYEVLYNQAGGNGDYLYVGLSSPDADPSVRFYRSVRGSDGEQYPNTGATEVRFTTNDIINVAVDLDAGKWYIGRNGTYWYSGDPVAGTGFVHSDLISNNSATTTDGLIPFFYNATSGAGQEFSVNFGQRPFSYTPPSGFKEINSSNLPLNVPSIIRPQKHFDTILYTGNASTQKITGLEFKPDMIWFKSRTSTSTHGIADSVRGRSKLFYPDTSQAEETSSSTRDLISFDDGGFTLGNPQVLSSTNGSGLSIVAWCWKAGGNSNTFNIDGVGYATAAAAGLDEGTANPTGASVNTKAGFSIVQFEAQSSGDITLSHGLGKKPEFWMWKSVDNNIDWYNYHHSLGYNAWLNNSANNAAVTGNDAAWKAEPTSTVFTHGSGLVNQNTIIMYMWTSIPGYSKMGSYTGNGNSDGPYVHLGFRPAFVWIKCSSSTFNWMMYDSKRETSNVIDKYLMTNSSNAEAGSTTDNPIDFLSDGFKLRYTNTSTNQSGGTYIYMAYAEQPGTTPFDTFPNAR